MTTSKAIIPADDAAYTQLYVHIRQLVLDARQVVGRAVDTCQVMASYEIERRIVEHEQQGTQRAEYGKQVLKLFTVMIVPDAVTFLETKLIRRLRRLTQIKRRKS